MPPPELRVSLLRVPIQIPLQEVDSLLNSVIGHHLHSERDREIRKGILSARLDLDIFRNGRIRVKSAKGGVQASIPLRATGRVKKGFIKEEFETTFIVFAFSAMEVDSMWNVIPKTRGSFIWKDEPELNILGIDINLAGSAGEAMKRQISKLTPKMDEIISTSIRLRSHVEDIWQKLSDPIEISDQPPAWLKINPVRFSYSPMISQGDTVVFGFSASAFIETVMKEFPGNGQTGQLPPISESALPEDGFYIDLPVSMGYEEAGELATELLHQKEFELSNRSRLQVSKVEIWGSGDELIAGVHFLANIPARIDVSGQLFFRGKPVYDNQNQTVRIDSLDYDIGSQNTLTRFADWLLHEELVGRIQERLQFPMANYINSAHLMLEEALTNRKLGGHFLINGEVDELEPGYIYLGQDQLFVKITARGQLTARLKDLRRAGQGGASKDADV